jgi:transposase, IS5 family
MKICSSGLFYARVGLTSHPLRKMIALLVLKHLYNLSDERVVACWKTDAYFQYFAGESTFNEGNPVLLVIWHTLEIDSGRKS